jgi:hypothetical protein
MTNLIYQVWSGEMRPGCLYSSQLVKEYAKKIGADYRLDISPNIASKTVSKDGAYWEWLNPILDDSFLQYDKVCVLDLDIFPVNNLDDNIFDQHVDCFGVCTEPFQGKLRSTVTIAGCINQANDEKWAKISSRNWGGDFPRDSDRYLKVYNAGMVMFTNEGLLLARDKFVPFQKYTDVMKREKLGRFYTVDQNYFHSMIVSSGLYTELDNSWNCYIHYIRGPLSEIKHIHDGRTADAKFVHIQLRGADYFTNEQLYSITNLEESKWNLNN